MTEISMIGWQVILKTPMLGNPAGVKGYVFNQYQDYDEPDKLGVQVIFPNGEYDGFSIQEQRDHLEMVHPILAYARYRFTNVMQVSKDFAHNFWDFTQQQEEQMSSNLVGMGVADNYEDVKLAADMIRWRKLQEELSVLELYIRDTVMKKAKSVVVAGVRARYTEGRTTYDYKGAVIQALKDDNGPVIMAVTLACKDPDNLKDSVFTQVAKRVGLLVESSKSAPQVSVMFDRVIPNDDNLGHHTIVSGGEVLELKS